jgi:signal transduction histidine kinase
MIRFSNEIVGNILLLKITDNGSGIPEAFKERVFEPFVKIVKGKGIGVEMALAKRMIEKQGGKIHVDSQEGKGSTYSITMPLGP